MEEIKLYLYKPFNTFSKAENHLKWLINYFQQKIWFTPAKNFNDPYEGVFSIDYKNEGDYLENDKGYLDHQWESYNDRLLKKGGNPVSREDFENQVLKKEFQKELIEYKKGELHTAFGEHGVLCLARNNSDILMWSHYADSHSGYCLEFTIDIKKLCALILGWYWVFSYSYILEWIKDLFNQKRPEEPLRFSLKNSSQETLNFIFLNVTYLKMPVSIEPYHIYEYFEKKIKHQPRDILEKTLGSKYETWQYEDEMRLIVDTNSFLSKDNLCDLRSQIPFMSISGIIFGCEMDPENIDKIKNLDKKENIKCYQAKKSETKFQIEVIEISD